MKPENLPTQLNQEQPSTQYGQNIEHIPALDNPETGINTGDERYEQKAEMQAITSDATLTTVIPTPVVGEQHVVDNTSIGSAPLVANDDDLIEKEWVDKAKKIVAETQNNPYGREEAVNKLQVDYLKKRYGRELGATE